MFPQFFKTKLISLLGEIKSIKPLSGGSINNAYQISTSHQIFFLKFNSNEFALKMFEVEAKGLQILTKSNSIKIPNVIHVGKVKNIAFLILEYLESSFVNESFWEKFGQQLAILHQTTADKFGLDHSNFIGSLPQSNNYSETWVDFFIHERILPQISLAEKKQLLPYSIHQAFENLFKKLTEIFPKELPALIHGDLWSGNFIKGKSPALIDPSVSFGHREMDLAMSYLFGGFDERFYQSYEEVFPMQPNFKNRVKVYQLYYLMVHVNLFGKGYLSSVQNILKRYQ